MNMEGFLGINHKGFIAKILSLVCRGGVSLPWGETLRSLAPTEKMKWKPASYS
jgi:hypothetical protein